VISTGRTLVIRRPSLLAAAVVAVAPLLLLTACSGGARDEKPKSVPSPHPVFSKPLDTQPYEALQQTHRAGSASFTQTVTYASKQGDAVLTIKGRLDFAGSRGDGTRAWKVPTAFPAAAKDAILGETAGGRRGASSARIAVETQDIHLRPGSAAYWLRYGADTGPLYGLDHVTRLRGTAAPISGTLLEVLSGARATGQDKTPDGGRSYRTEVPLNLTWSLVPTHLWDEVDTDPQTDAATPTPLTLTVDAEGRITHAEADLSALRKGKGGALSHVTAIRAELSVTGHSTSKPTMPTVSETILDAGEAVRLSEKTKAGECIDFNTGIPHHDAVVRVSCSTSHDGRVFAQVPLGAAEEYPGDEAAERRAMGACERAKEVAPAAWTQEAEPGSYWSMWPGPTGWGVGSKPVATCYVVSRP
jgi:hypothetical protein